ncbi:hypothetical protein [Actinokineospora enzanensis]|uniref:hypothetical protein n=1 Tax=Actinokineospora enzanensis TaxID=155975 RepID=UPI0003814D4F|nr:hypothetical protein [Actinokineospora enzanensis]
MGARREVHNTVSGSHAENIIQAGVVKGGLFRRVYRVSVDMPRPVRITFVVFLVMVLLGASTFAVVTWVLPQFAPTYKTEFLVDLSAGDVPDDFGASADSLRKALGNSGDDDALALRGFGGDCGSDANTNQLVGFGTGNRTEVADAVHGAHTTGAATLLRGIVEATQDFSGPFTQRAKQVNRIIVVTRHGIDACDDDADFVEKEIRDRVAASGLSLEFRFVGYRVPHDQNDVLARLASGAGAPPPVLADNQDQLRGALDWFTNVEPVLRSATQVVDAFNPTVAKVDQAVQAIIDGRLDVAARTLDEVKPTTADAEFENLRTRARTPDAVALHTKALSLRDRQRDVLDSASRLLDTARSGSPLGQRLTGYQQAADNYNANVDDINRMLAQLRAQAPGGGR